MSLSRTGTVPKHYRCSLHHRPAEPSRCFNPGGFRYPKEFGLTSFLGCWWNRDSLEGIWGKPVRH